MSFATSWHLKKLVEFRPRLHLRFFSCRCATFQTWDATCNGNFRMLNIKSELRTNWNVLAFVNDFTKSKWDQPIDEVSPGPAWQSTIRLAQKHFSKDWGCGLDTANLRCNLQFCQRMACEYLKSRPICLRTVRPCCFNVWLHVSANPGSRRLPANVP